ncbi:MAG: glycosyltransferase family 2 protein [bacterium]
MEPLVSAVIPCYKQGHFLAEAVQSVLGQTVNDLECIVVNDGSPDTTREVAMQLASGDPRVRYIEQVNRGLAAARNRGLGEARGRFIQFLDADDIIAPDKLRIQTDILRAQSRWAVAYSDHRYCPQHDTSATVPSRSKIQPRFVMGKPLWDMAARWETQLSIPIHSFLFDAGLFRSTGICFDESLPTHEDWDCWMRILEVDPIVVHTPGELAIYRLHPDSMTTNQRMMWRGFACAIRNRHRHFTGDPIMRGLLLEKLVELADVYAEPEEGAGGAAVRRTMDVLRRIAPWPFQVWVRRLTVHVFLRLGIDMVW